MTLKTIKSVNPQQEGIDRDSDLSDSPDQEPEDLDSLEGLGEEDASPGWWSSPSVLALLKLLPLGLSTFTLLYLFYLGGQLASIRTGHNRVLVQTIHGRSIQAEPVDTYVRTPVTVEETVKLWGDLTFNWVPKLPNGEKDQGKRIGSKVFPLRLIYASTLMTHDTRQLWYQMFQARDDLLPGNFLASGATRVYYPKLQTMPRLALDPRTGKPINNSFEVELYGEWVEYGPSSPQGKLVDKAAFLLRLRPVVKTEEPLSDDADSLQRAAYELRANGLEIYDIERIKRK
ncbi:hypothetical protein AVDCRST_MAG94-5114 [uncultured Leptolyngbya sp.]|uniref:Uncharacterized protein n=1 Tax=uncultured Leptolyngbya sp. TaxID=332963 RepID=A0A6J4NHQ7_9CYAN|nr:hypothetical protein AVDCRST_MAG94-5114 [uncultured Leptolyngbya sp.]